MPVDPNAKAKAQPKPRSVKKGGSLDKSKKQRVSHAMSSTARHPVIYDDVVYDDYEMMPQSVPNQVLLRGTRLSREQRLAMLQPSVNERAMGVSHRTSPPRNNMLHNPHQTFNQLMAQFQRVRVTPSFHPVKEDEETGKQKRRQGGRKLKKTTK